MSALIRKLWRKVLSTAPSSSCNTTMHESTLVRIPLEIQPEVSIIDDSSQM